MKTIIVTGSVGSGKTTLVKKLAKKLNYEYVDVSKLIVKEKLSSGYDYKKKCEIIDVKKLNQSLVRLINNKSASKTKGIIIDSHLSQYLQCKYVDFCLVTKCDLKILKKRLEKRKYSKEKIRENIDCEIFDVCLEEAKDNKHNIIVIDATKGINTSKILQKIR